jgi:hypothetical protein
MMVCIEPRMSNGANTHRVLVFTDCKFSIRLFVEVEFSFRHQLFPFATFNVISMAKLDNFEKKNFAEIGFFYSTILQRILQRLHPFNNKKLMINSLLAYNLLIWTNITV